MLVLAGTFSGRLPGPSDRQDDCYGHHPWTALDGDLVSADRVCTHGNTTDGHSSFSDAPQLGP